MKPAMFSYVAPRTISETVDLLGELQYDAKILAGGQSLMPIMNMRLAQPTTLIDINMVEGISEIEITDEHLVIGALVRQQQLVDDPRIAESFPLLQYAAHFIAHRTIRNRGTVGGSLVHSDPASELPALMVALNAVMSIQGPSGERQIPAEEFFLDFMTVALEPNELLVDVRIPLRGAPDSGWAFQEISRRHGDFAIVAVVALVVLDASGAFFRNRLVISGVGAAPHVVEATSEYIGHQPDDESIIAIARAAGREINPQDDIQGSSAYRRRLARVLSERAMRLAVDRARGTTN